MNDDKSSKFLFSTPIKHKKIQIFKRKKEEGKEEGGDVYDQLSKILEDESSGGDDQKEINKEQIQSRGLRESKSSNQSVEINKEQENKIFHKSKDTNENDQNSHKQSPEEHQNSNIIEHSHTNKHFHTKHSSNLQHSHTNKYSDHDLHTNKYSDHDSHTNKYSEHDLHTNKYSEHDLHTKHSNSRFTSEIPTVSLCTLLVDRISKERILIKKLEDELDLLKNSIKEKHEKHESSEKFVCELKQSNQDLISKNASLKYELDSTIEMFSRYKQDMTSIINTLSDNINICILENTRLSKENYSIKTNIYLLENILKEELDREKNVKEELDRDKNVKEELDIYVEEISRLHTLKHNMKIRRIINTATGILRMALGIVEEEIELIETSKGEIENIKKESKIHYKENENILTEYYLGVINGMNENLEECCFRILEEQSKVECVYFTFRNEIKRLKRKVRKIKNKTKSKKTSSDSDIWDIFK